MSPVPRIAGLLLYISSIAWIYLYLYPIWLGCGFPLTQSPSRPPAPQQQFPFFQHDYSRQAPFRLLVLADPQLEGDTSLPDLEWTFESFSVQELGRKAVNALKYARKKVDLWGNDLYLAHIYRSLQSFTAPTHVTVLGDLLGSQWISDEEFNRRADRFWNVVFSGSNPVFDITTQNSSKEVLGARAEWRYTPMAVVGNHDVGYSGDMTEARLERFERRFGPVNWDIEFELPDSKSDADEAANDLSQSAPRPSIRILLLNSMNLDSPVYDESLQAVSYKAMNSFIERSRDVRDKDVFTILLTHVPLYKPEGVCTDAPWFDYFPEDNGGGVKEQNLLSEHSSEALLEGVFGMSDVTQGRNGVILTGHDHTGCDVWHYLPPEGALETSRRWNATGLLNHLRTNMTSGMPGIREVTMRAMMGEFDGNAAFVSAWYDEEERQWGYAVSKCAFGPQHIWWAVHVVFLITGLVGAVAVYEWQFAAFQDRRRQKKAKVTGLRLKRS